MDHYICMCVTNRCFLLHGNRKMELYRDNSTRLKSFYYGERMCEKRKEACRDRTVKFSKEFTRESNQKKVITVK